jgi:hypothetical protein
MQVAPRSSPAISAKRDRDVAAVLPGGSVGKTKPDVGTPIVGDSDMPEGDSDMPVGDSDMPVGDSDTTGAWVGAAVAPGIVGPRLGAGVGVPVGPSLGASVETTMGLFVGLKVGSPFGIALQAGSRAFTQKGIN